MKCPFKIGDLVRHTSDGSVGVVMEVRLAATALRLRRWWIIVDYPGIADGHRSLDWQLELVA